MLQAIYEAVDSGEASARVFFADFSKGFDLIDHYDLSTDMTVDQRPETVTLLPSGLVYLLLCFVCKVSIHHLLRLFYVCLLLKRKN